MCRPGSTSWPVARRRLLGHHDGVSFVRFRPSSLEALVDLTRWASVLVVAVCVFMLVRLALPAPRRARLDHRLQRVWRDGPQLVRRRWHALRHGRRHRVDAERLARDAIERARKTTVERDGNVIKPDAFNKGPRKPH